MAELIQKLATYKPAATTIRLIHDTKIMFLVGVAGAGKDAIKHELLKTDAFHYIVSHTTRSARVNHGIAEVDGKDYHFVDFDTVSQMLTDQAFVEAKQVHGGNVYGTSVTEIQAAHDEHKIAFTDIEVQGVAEYKTIDPAIMALFILPVSFEVWQQRLERRYGESIDRDDYRARMITAITELNEFLDTSHYIGVINDDLDQAVATVTAIAKGEPVPEGSQEAARRVAKDLLRGIKANLQLI